ncbi:MAG: hypothetical protein AB1611_05210 [bacterium]
MPNGEGLNGELSIYKIKFIPLYKEGTGNGASLIGGTRKRRKDITCNFHCIERFYPTITILIRYFAIFCCALRGTVAVRLHDLSGNPLGYWGRRLDHKAIVSWGK